MNVRGENRSIFRLSKEAAPGLFSFFTTPQPLYPSKPAKARWTAKILIKPFSLWLEYSMGELLILLKNRHNL